MKLKDPPMDIRFSDEENAFRAEVRAFLQQAWTPELAATFSAVGAF